MSTSTKTLYINQHSIAQHHSHSHSLVLEEDTNDCANFLLSLKNNNNSSPEPASNEPTTPSQTTPIKTCPFTYPAVINAYDSDDNYPSLMDEHVPENMPTINLEPLLGFGDSLVCMSDRDLVPDALFLAIGQMKVVHLTESDRVGCYKTRPIGFVGLGCKHCGGQPGFGKYFPETVRSLAQTTTSQTILKHIGSKCRFCPPEVRQAVLDLQHQQAIKEAAIAGRPRYGSRKVFFQRIWGRLHDEHVPDYPVELPKHSVLPHGLIFIADVAAAPPTAPELIPVPAIPLVNETITQDPFAPPVSETPVAVLDAPAGAEESPVKYEDIEIPAASEAVEVPAKSEAVEAPVISEAVEAPVNSEAVEVPPEAVDATAAATTEIADDVSTASTASETSHDENGDHKQKQRRFGGLPTKKNLMKRKQLADSASSAAPPPQRAPSKRQRVANV